jgi:hypothetical protein
VTTALFSLIGVLVTAVGAILVAPGFDLFTPTGRMRRRLRSDAELAADLEGAAKSDMLAHVDTRTRILITAEEPWTLTEMQMRSTALTTFSFSFLLFVVVTGQEAIDPTRWSDIGGRLAAALFLFGAFTLHRANRRRTERQAERLRSAVPEPDTYPFVEDLRTLPLVWHVLQLGRYLSSRPRRRT